MEQKMKQLLTNCHLCTADIFFPIGEDIVTCRYCGHLNQRPVSTGETLVRMERADELRRQCAFEEAARSYEHVLREHPDEHAALWGRLMCKYGVETVEERRYGRLISRQLLCHRARNSSIRNEGDYKHACALAAPEIREQYERDAEYIDNVQVKIRELARNKEPWDVFICYKETDLEDPSKQTEDSTIARALCNRIQREGYRVFFAPYSLEHKAGEVYEAEIYRAIHTAKIMFVLGLKPEHFEAIWPRSEWMRFMDVMADNSALLIPVFGGGMTARQLPREILNMGIHGFNIDDHPGYLEDLVFTIRKHLSNQPVQEQIRPVASTPESMLERSYSDSEEWKSDDTEKNNESCKTEYPEKKALANNKRRPWLWAIAAIVVVFAYAAGAGQFDLRGLISDAPVEGTASSNVPTNATPPASDEASENTPTKDTVSATTDVPSANLIDVSEFIIPDASSFVFTDHSDFQSTSSGNPDMKQNRSEFTYTLLSDGTAEITGYTGNSGDLHIPSELDEYLVTSIGEYAFHDCKNLVSIAIPDGVTCIGNDAFADCKNLTNIAIPESVLYIGDFAFNNCESLTSITIPDGVTSIGDWVFSCCTSLAYISIPESVIYIGDFAFNNCENLTSITIPDGVTSFGKSAFENCYRLASMTIPDSVTFFDNGAFNGCDSLTIKTPPDSYAARFAKRYSIPVSYI